MRGQGLSTVSYSVPMQVCWHCCPQHHPGPWISHQSQDAFPMSSMLPEVSSQIPVHAPRAPQSFSRPSLCSPSPAPPLPVSPPHAQTGLLPTTKICSTGQSLPSSTGFWQHPPLEEPFSTYLLPTPDLNLQSQTRSSVLGQQQGSGTPVPESDPLTKCMKFKTQPHHSQELIQ